jgi:hypothetical protein
MFTKKAIFFMVFLVLMMVMTVDAQEGTIVFTSRPDLIDEATGVTPDMPHINALEEAGYDVVIFYNDALSTASEATLDTLYDANLIIYGRSTPSTTYGNHKIAWNDITTPVLCLELWACRNSRLNWFDTDEMDLFTSEADSDSVFYAIIEAPDDPVFEGIDTEDHVPWMIGINDQIKTTDPGNGTLLAWSESTDDVLFVRFEPDDEFYEGAGDYAGGYRSFIGNGRDNSSEPPFNFYNFTEESETVFFREVERLFVLGGGVMPSPVENREIINAPSNFELSQNYPNPFNPTTIIPFTLPEQSHVRLSLINILGEEIMEIVNGEYGAGQHKITFTAENLATGIYFYKIKTEKYTSVKKLIFAK